MWSLVVLQLGRSANTLLCVQAVDKYRTDIEVTNEQIVSGAAPLQVRRGSEPALNHLIPSSGKW